VVLGERTKTTGVIMCEQFKSLDVQARHVSFIEKLPSDILHEVLDILNGFIEME
jgi:mRNA interferase MazF